MQGTYQNCTSRSVNTKFGPKTAFDVTIDGRKIGLGFNNKLVANLQPGTVVEYAVEEGQYPKVTSIVAVSGEAAPAATPATPVAQTATSSPTNKDWGLALHNALEFVNAHYSSPLVKKSLSLPEKFKLAVAYADMIVQYGLTGKVVTVDAEEEAKLQDVAEEAETAVN